MKNISDKIISAKIYHIKLIKIEEILFALDIEVLIVLILYFCRNIENMSVKLTQ